MSRSRLPSYEIVPATFVIGKAGSSKNIGRADAVCPASSTSDQTYINAVINALPTVGGKISLLEGSYIIDGDILPKSNTIIKGTGYSTEIKIKNGINANVNMINLNTLSNVRINNIKLNGNKTNRVGGNQDSIILTSSNNCIIGENYSIDINNNAIYLNGSSYNILKNNYVADGAIYGLGGTYNIIRENIASNCIYIDTCNNYSLISNLITNSLNWGIVLSGADNCVISLNKITRSQQHGIYINWSNNNNILSNHICEASQAANNTYDGIYVNNNSDYNNIQSNMCRAGVLANRPRYGINIGMATCDANFVTNNDLLTSGATGSLNDAGVGTVIVAGNRL